MANVAVRLNLNQEEIEVFNEMNAWERRTFNALPNENAKVILFELSWREKELGMKNRYV